MTRRSRSTRYLSALRRAEAEGGDNPDTVLNRQTVPLTVADDVFIVVNQGGRPGVETVSIDKEIDVRVIVPSALKDVGNAHVVKAVGGMPSLANVYVDERGMLWWNYAAKALGPALEVIQDDVLSYVDKAAETKAWTCARNPGLTSPLYADLLAEEYLKNLPGAFSGIYGVSPERDHVFIGSRKPAIVVSVEPNRVQAILVDTVRQDMPHYPVETPESWVDALLRFAPIEMEQLKVMLAAIDVQEPHMNVVGSWETLHVGRLLSAAPTLEFSWAAERGMMQALRMTSLVEKGEIKDHIKSTPALATFDDKKRAPRAAFFHKLDELLMENETAYRAFAKEAGWPFVMTPVQFLALRYEGIDRLAADFNQDSKLARVG